jgi:hypothetical protein
MLQLHSAFTAAMAKPAELEKLGWLTGLTLVELLCKATPTACGLLLLCTAQEHV